MFNDEIFGITVGYITTLSIITGLYLAGAKKEMYIASLMAILISDPLSHLFAFNISSSVLEWKGVLYQLIVNMQIILTFLLSNNMKNALIMSYLLCAITNIAMFFHSYSWNHILISIFGTFFIVAIHYPLHKLAFKFIKYYK